MSSAVFISIKETYPRFISTFRPVGVVLSRAFWAFRCACVSSSTVLRTPSAIKREVEVLFGSPRACLKAFRIMVSIFRLSAAIEGGVGGDVRNL